MTKQQVSLLLISMTTLSLGVFLIYNSIRGGINISSERAIAPTPINTQQALESVQTVEIENTASAMLVEDSAYVVKVIDGDTIEIELKGQKYHVRYIGIDTPETVDPRREVQCFGREASNENKSLVEGKRVILEKDITDEDKYNRLLRYVYLKLDDGSMLFVNDYLVRQGFARSSTYPPDIKYQERLIEAEREARVNKKGLWVKC